MSTLVTAKPYDRVLDGQKHYRTLLQCTARPGTIGQLDDALVEVPPQLNRATALLALALFSADSTFFLAQCEEPALEFLRRETFARMVSAEEADFLICSGASCPDEIRRARTGSLAFPDQGSTVVAQVAAVSPAPIPGGFRLTLTGPGIEMETVVFVLGAGTELFEFLRERNAEFPLGVDTFLTCDSLSAGPCVLSLPRTTRVQWEHI